MHRTQAAYNAEEVTAAFNLRNLLARVNRELGADSDLAQWRHRAPYKAAQGRIEMRSVSRLARTVALQGRTLHFAEGETIHTENPYIHGNRYPRPGATGRLHHRHRLGGC